MLRSTLLLLALSAGMAVCSVLHSEDASPSGGVKDVRVAHASAEQGLVNKVAESFETAPWVADTWATAPGKTALSTEAAPGIGSQRSLQVEVNFPARQGFTWFAAHPSSPLVIPGELKSVRVRCRNSDPRCQFYLRFKDGWGRTEAGGAKFEWALACKNANEWTSVEYKIPAEWVQPITVDAVLAHNWAFQNEARTVRCWLQHLEVQTDTTRVDPETGVLKTWRPNADEKDPKKQLKEPPRTPLLSAEIATDAVSNVFSRTEPSVSVTVRNWKPGTLSGQFRYVVLDMANQKVLEQEQPLSVDSAATLAFPLKVERFGRYTLTTTLVLKDTPPRTQTMVFARLPDYPELDDARKRASPYGLNVHGGNEKLRLEPFRAAGLVWFRDYAFSWDWLLRAKGADKRYAGWPWYPTLMRRYEDLGLKVLPCLMDSITPPTVQNGQAVGRVGPDRAWALELADILSAFPKVTHWELGNEYDLKDSVAKNEEAIHWANYRAYHKQFGEVLQVLGHGELTAVENGRAGIWPEREKACVASGDFAALGVLNSHHYCGTEAPELNYGNFNMGVAANGDEAPALLFDRLRAVKRAACSDGKPRESWLTEFGWDTLAGPVVTPYEQAAYLPRAWLLALAAGTEKCFWFFDYDALKPLQFFDGCGLLAADGSPKLALCALAGMTSRLPNPKYIGEISVNPNTWGYVFENDGKLVAALWTIRGDTGTEVTFQAEQLFDFLGNKLPGRTARLRLAPTYAVGLSKDDPLYKQTAYSFDTPYLIAATAGERVTPVLQIKNNRAAALQGTAKLSLPGRWSADQPEVSFEAAPGETKQVPLPFTLAPNEGYGEQSVLCTIAEAGPIKTIPLRVLVRPALTMEVSPLSGPPGKTEITVKVGNQSSGTLRGTLSLLLPAAWHAAVPEQDIEDLKSGEVRAVTCALEWNTDWKPGESAQVVFAAPDGKSVQRPIIPRVLRLHKAPALKLDGKVDDWPLDCELPAWVLGSTLGEAQARVFLGWSADGLYGAVEVHASKLSVPDPRSFWTGDCLELFVDTADDKREREYQTGDHQFWFVPLLNENRVYVGRWKRKNEIPETQYDLPGVKSAAVRVAGGYVMEFLLPASALHGYQPRVGSRLGVSLNLSVKGQRLNREVYWPRSKSDETVLNSPQTWGSMELSE